MSGHLSVLGAGLGLIVEPDHLGDGAQVNVVADVAEKGGRHSPEDPVFPLGKFLLGLIERGLGRLSVDDLMVAGEDVTSSDMLEHSTCLEEKAAGRDLDSDLLHVSEPDIETWVARFTVDGQEIEVVVEASKSCTHIVLLEV